MRPPERFSCTSVLVSGSVIGTGTFPEGCRSSSLGRPVRMPAIPGRESGERETVAMSGAVIRITGLAQYPRRGEPPAGGPGHYIRIEGGRIVNEDELRTARETASHSTGTPEWTNPREFEKDVFTFARVIFQSDRSGRGEFGGGF